MANKYPHQAIESVRRKAVKSKVEFECKYCGKKEMLPQSIVNRRGGKKYCSLECRRKSMWGKNSSNYGNTQGISKEKNPNWKGGISKHRKGRMMIAEQAKWRRLVYRRDNHICRRCGYDKGKILNAHHIATWANYPGKRFDISNGLTLCKTCHDWVHSDENIKGDYICN